MDTIRSQISIRFYIVLALSLLSLAIIIALTARGVFSGLKTAGEVDESLLNVSTPRLIEPDLKKAVDLLNEKSAPALDAL